jgi:hypothetical protein
MIQFSWPVAWWNIPQSNHSYLSAQTLPGQRGVGFRAHPSLLVICMDLSYVGALSQQLALQLHFEIPQDLHFKISSSRLFSILGWESLSLWAVPLFVRVAVDRYRLAQTCACVDSS